LEVFHATAIQSASGPLGLTEATLYGLLAACPSLQKVGNLSKWRIDDMEGVMAHLFHSHRWRRILANTQHNPAVK
jgi:hypothetical protein